MGDTPFFESELFAELSEDLKASSRFTATYRIKASDYEEAKKLAFGICVEQTVECPYELVEDTPIGDTIVGQIESINKADPGAYYAVISYDPDAVGHEMSELVNMFFGNTSLQPGIRLMSFELPDFMYNDYPGPRFGREGIRELCGVEHGPILMSAIKPLGKSPKELAEMVYKLALGGCPIIKDDHSLMNQDYAPFEERVLQCVMALADAKEKTGKKSMYIANCTADGLQMLDRAYKAQEIGADGIMVEVHNDPAHALCDGAQSITPPQIVRTAQRGDALPVVGAVFAGAPVLVQVVERAVVDRTQQVLVQRVRIVERLPPLPYVVEHVLHPVVSEEQTGVGNQHGVIFPAQFVERLAVARANP